MTTFDLGNCCALELDVHDWSTKTVAGTDRLLEVNVAPHVLLAVRHGTRHAVIDADALTDIGWALLTAAHLLRRLQGERPHPVPDPQLTIFDALPKGKT